MKFIHLTQPHSRWRTISNLDWDQDQETGTNKTGIVSWHAQLSGPIPGNCGLASAGSITLNVLNSLKLRRSARRFDDSFDPLLRKRHRKLTFAWPLQSSRFHVGTMGRLTRSLPHLTNIRHHLKIEFGVFAIIFGLSQVIMPSKTKLVSAIWR